MRFSLSCVFIVLFFGAGTMDAQKLPFKNYTIKDGLLSDAINDIVQDNKGYIWFATQNGISKFDGYRFENYGIADGLPSKDIHYIFCDSKGNIWCSAYGSGIAKYNGRRFQSFSVSDGLIDKYINFIFEDGNGQIWAASESGISCLTGNNIKSYSKENGLTENHITCHYISSDGTIFLGSTGGYNVLKPGASGAVIAGKGLREEIITDITGGQNGSVWFATQGNGIFVLDGNSVLPAAIDRKYGDIVLCINPGIDGNLWCGTYEQGAFVYNVHTGHTKQIAETNGLTITDIFIDKSLRTWLITHGEGIFIVEKERIRRITTTNNLAGNTVATNEVDLEGNVWFGTLSGVSKYGKVPFEIYTEDFGLPHKEIMAVFSDRNGRIWTGSYNGPAILPPGGEHFIPLNMNSLYKTVFSIYQDKSDNIWLGTYLGITGFKDNHFRIFRDSIWNKGGEAENFAYDFVEDNIGGLWIAHNNGISKFSGEVFYNYSMDDGLPDNTVKALAYDRQGNLWIATLNGLAIYDGNEFEVITTSDGLSYNICQDLCIDMNGKIWVATDNGLNKVTWQGPLKDITTYTTADGLYSNAITFVTADINNNLWIGLEKGFNRMNLNSGKITYYGEQEGFTPLECYERAVSVDKDQNVWIGTGNGVVKYISDYDTISVYKPRTYIKKIKLYNDSTDIAGYADGLDSITGLPVNLVLPYNKNNLEFEYVGIHFAIPQKNRYKYMLKGYDEKWSEPTVKTITEPYRKIPHGSYTFMLLAANSDDEWIDEPVTFGFIIKPPFWKTPWAYASGIIITLFVLYSIIKLRERKLQQDKRVLAQKVKERTIEIEKQRDHIEQQNKEITSSIMYAQRIQNAVLPNIELINKLLPDHFILFKPRDIVSGDFYWVTEKENKVILVAADCTGHGVPGAFMSMLGVSLLNEIVNNQSAISACEILNLLRGNVKKTLSQKGRHDETKDGMDLVLCIFDFNKYQVQFAGAYNPLWIIRNDELMVFKGDKMPIGIYVGKENPFTCNDIPLQKNDMIYMFSDGYADQFGGPDEKKFKSGALKDLLLEINKKPLHEQKEILESAHLEWKGDVQQIDDIMVIGVRV
ncbi:MAG: SpoIIE family protein phosphatase [Bacteroidales bacterium]|nr:SpoIIE family protein phosphatase [Bacteroidales bacterium]